MHATRIALGMVVSLLGIAGAGCSGFSEPLPGVTYSVAPITRDGRGKVNAQEPGRNVELALVEDVQEVVQDGRTLVVQVRKTQYGKATFAITFPDHTTQLVQVKQGQSKDVLPKRQRVGVRLTVQEAH